MLGIAHFENVGLDWTTFWVISGLTIFFLILTTVMSKLANNNAVELPAVILWAYFKITSYIWALVFALCIVLAFLFGLFPAHKGLVLDNNSGAEVVKTTKSGRHFVLLVDLAREFLLLALWNFSVKSRKLATTSMKFGVGKSKVTDNKVLLEVLWAKKISRLQKNPAWFFDRLNLYTVYHEC